MTGHEKIPNGTVLIDTSAWICFFSRKGFDQLKEIVSLLLDENRAAIAGPIFVELVQGCRTLNEKEHLEEVFEGILWHPVTGEIWRHAADLGFNLRRKGVTVPAMDSLIAAIAIDCDSALLHYDSDFTFISKHSKLRQYSTK